MIPDNNLHDMQHTYIVGFDQLDIADIFLHCIKWNKQKE